jgi:hypothetical protein
MKSESAFYCAFTRSDCDESAAMLLPRLFDIPRKRIPIFGSKFCQLGAQRSE